MGFNLNEYEPVEARLTRFWEAYPNGRVLTELQFQDDTRFIVYAAVFTDREDARPAASGYAEERVDNNPKRVNFASALENCETSSIGRALANLGLSPKGARPSLEEMEKVSRTVSRAENEASPAGQLANTLREYSQDAAARKALVVEVVGKEIGSLAELTADEIKNVRIEVARRITEAQAPFISKEQA